MNRRSFLRSGLTVSVSLAFAGCKTPGQKTGLNAQPIATSLSGLQPVAQAPSVSNSSWPPATTSPDTTTVTGSAFSVLEAGAKGDGVTDDTAAIQKALAEHDRIYLPPGTYLVNNVQLKTGTELFGSGDTSIIKQHPSAQWAVSANPGNGGTPNPADNMNNLSIHDLKFLGQAGQLPFDEHVHLLNLNAVSQVQVTHCTFAGYLGDGIYLGSSNDGGLERHNDHVTIQNCLFDGLVKDNRNGISIIDGSSITVSQCTFTRSGNRQMPGGIDIEPNPTQNPYVLIQGIVIDQCTFTDMGSMSMVCIALQPQDQLRFPASDIQISNCHASQPGSHSQVVFYVRQGEGVQPDNATQPLGLTINNCQSDGIPSAMTIESVKGMQVRDSAFNSAAAPNLSQSIDCVFSSVTVNGQAYQPA